MLLRKELGVIEHSYYEASVARRSPEPPLAGATTADVCVVGGGYAGLSAALELAERGYAVVLLEAQRLGWGASGRNGGQVIVGFGGGGEAAIERQFGREDAKRAWSVALEGVQLVRERIVRHGIDCEFQPGHLTLAVRPRKSRELRRWVEHAARAYGHVLRWIGPDEIRHWIASDRFDAGVFDELSGHLHPLKYCLGLADAARHAGVRLHEHSPAFVIERGSRPVVRTAEGACECRFVVLAGNVYLGEYGDAIAPEVAARIMPVGTYMIATEPMPGDRAEALLRGRPAAADTNFVLDYFRVGADGRMLFGGGDSFSGRGPRDVAARIRANMLQVFPQLADLDVPYAWGGFVDVTINQAPDFGRLGPNVYYLQGFSGHGLALAGMAGRLVALAIAGQAERFDLFARIRHHAFPGGALMRTPALVLGMLYYRLRDAL